MMEGAPPIRIHELYDDAPPFSRLLDELEPVVGCEAAYAITETARDVYAFIEHVEGEHCNARENLRRLRTSPTEFARAVPELQGTLERLLDLVRMDGGPRERCNAIAARAGEVRFWAETRGAVLTAVAFAQLAQDANEDSGMPDPAFAYDLGRIAASLPEQREAGVAWLRHARDHASALGRDDLATMASLLADLAEPA